MKPSLMRQILMAAAQLRASAGRFLTGLSFWPDVVRISTRICAPLVAFARWTLAAMPSLRKAEWLLEIESLTKRHPVTLAVSIAFVFFRGFKTSGLGHIGTDLLIYPFLAAVSGFNPFLGLVCGVIFGIGDLIQKLLWNDIYATAKWGWTDTAYWGAIVGYILAYSSTMTMGVLPGMASRTFRLGVRYAIARMAFKKAAAAADGARPPQWNDPPLPERETSDPWGKVMPGHVEGARANAAWGATPAPPTGDGGYMAGHLAGARQTPNLGPVTAMFNRAPAAEEHPAAKAAREFHQSLQTSPKLQAEVRALQADPRNLLADPDAWRTQDLTPRQKTLLAQLRGQRLLGAEGNQRLDQMIGRAPAASGSALYDGGGDSVDLRPGVGGGGNGGSLSLLEFLAGMAGGSLAAMEHMLVNAGAMEAPAFFIRGPGRADVGCHKLEVDKYLTGRAPELGLVGAGAGAIDSLSKAGGGSRGPGGGPSREELEGRINAADNFNFNSVDPKTGAEMANLINKLRDDLRNGRLNEQDLIDLERMQGNLTAGNKAGLDQDFIRQSEENSKIRAERDAAEAREAAEQARLRDEYDRIINKYTNSGLESAESMSTIDGWRDRVVKNGKIDPQALEDMTRILGGKTRNLGQREAELAQAVADAAGRQEKAAQLVRDGAIAAVGGFAGGALGAVPALQGWGGTILVNGGIGAISSAASAASDNWNDPNFGAKVLQAAGTGALTGGAFAGGFKGAGDGWLGTPGKWVVDKLGNNPTLGGVVFGAGMGAGQAAWHGENVLAGGLEGGFLGGIGGKFGKMGHTAAEGAGWGLGKSPGVNAPESVSPDVPTEKVGARPSSELPTEKAPAPELPTEKAGARPSTEVPTEKAPPPDLPTEKGGALEPTEKIGASPSNEVPTEKVGPEATEKAGQGVGGDEPDVPFTNEEPITPAQEAEIQELSKLPREQLEKMADDALNRGDGDRLDVIDEALGRKQNQGGEALAEPLDMTNRQAEIDRLSGYSVENLKKLEEYHRSRGETAQADLINEAYEKRVGSGGRSGGMEPEVQRLSELPPDELDRRIAAAKANGDPNVTKYLEAAKTLQHERNAAAGRGGLEADYGGLDDFKAKHPDFNAERNRMQAAEANLRAAEASGDKRRIDLARENFEDARKNYIEADPRRNYKAAVAEREAAQAQAQAAEKAAADARAAAAKAGREASANPDNPQLQEQARQAKAAAEKARLENLAAEQKRVQAGEQERAASDRMREHLTKEAKLKEKIDAEIQKDLDSSGNDRKGGMKVVADSDALRDAQKDMKRVEHEWYPRADSPEVDPKNLKGDGVGGFNDRDTNRSAGLPDKGILTHERYHANTSQNWKDNLGGNRTLNEGMTHNLTLEQGQQPSQGGTGTKNADWSPALPHAYSPEVQVVQKLEAIVGKDTMRNAYGKGDTDALFAAVGKRAGAAPGNEVAAGRDYLNRLDQFTRIAQADAATAGQKATAIRNVETMLNRLERGMP